MFKYLFWAAAIIILSLTSCIEENENLVNPPSQVSTIKVRLINFASDKEARTLNLDNQLKISNISFGNTSEAVNPPIDSAVTSLYHNNLIEVKLARKVKFLRDSYYTAVCLPSPVGAERAKAVDTLLMFGTSIGLPKNTTNTYLKVLNAFPDSTVSFSLTIGCPNGEGIVSSLQYRNISSQKVMTAGKTPVSFIKITQAGVEILGLFELELLNDKQYTVIISDDSNGQPYFRLLDEEKSEVNALYPCPTISETTAGIRTINFSTENLQVKRMPDEIIENDALSGRIGTYKTVSACQSQALDSLAVINGTFESSLSAVSISVNEKYSHYIFDTKDKKGGLSMVVPSFKPTEDMSEKAGVRVINADYDINGATLSIGSRAFNNDVNFTSGEILCKSLAYEALYPQMNIPILGSEQELPITLFTSGQPAELLLSTTVNIKPNYNYVFVIAKNSIDETSLFVIEENQEDQEITELPKKQFFQLSNMCVGLPTIKVIYNQIIQEAKLGYLLNMATVSNIGNNQISLDNASYSFDAKADRRNILIAAGNYTSIDFINLETEYLPESMNYSRRRFVNACKEINEITVKVDSDTGYVETEALQYMTANGFKQEYKERNFSFFFYDASNDQLLYKITEVNMIHGKSYTFIFGGNKANGYKLNIVQDY